MNQKNSNAIKVLRDDVDGAGAVVFWSLSGPTNYEVFIDQLIAHGIPESVHPEPPTPAEAMRSAEKDCRKYLPAGFFTRKLDKHVYGVVREDRDSDDAKTGTETYEPVLKIGVAVTPVEDDNGKIIDHRIKFWSKYRRRDSAQDELGGYVSELVDRFRAARGELALHHMDWWTRRHCHVVALGERGKPYYVAPDRMASYTALSQAIAASGAHTFNSIPAMRSEDAINSVMAACLREVTKKCEAVYVALENEDKPLGARALRTKQSELDKLIEKMSSFESLLGPKLEQLREDIEECRATVVEVELMLDDD